MAVKSDSIQGAPLVLTNINGNKCQTRGMGVLAQLRSLGYGIFTTETGHDDKPPVWGLLTSSNAEERKIGAALIEDHEPHITKLADGILKNGQLQPIGVFKKKDNKFDVLFGMRRALACAYNFARAEKNGATVLARIFDKPTDTEGKFLSHDENENREAESPIDKALTFQWHKKEGGLSVDDIAKREGLTSASIHAYLRLLSPHLADKRMNIHQGDMSMEKALKLLARRKNDGSAELDQAAVPAAGKDRVRFPGAKAIVKIYNSDKKPSKMEGAEWELWITDDVRKLVAKLLRMKFKPFKAGKETPAETKEESPKSKKESSGKKILKVKKERIVKLLIGLGKTNARTWEDAELAKAIADISKLVEPDQKLEDDSLQQLLDKLISGTYEVKIDSAKAK